MKQKVFVTYGGRLGNQLFMAAFIDRYFPADVDVISAGFQEMELGFDWHRNAKTLDPREKPTKRLFRFLRQLAKLRLIKHIFQTKFDLVLPHGKFRLLDANIRKTPGLLPYTLIDRSHLQHHDHAGEVLFNLKDQYKTAAQSFLNNLPDGPKAFVHVRRGDYRDWKIIGISPLLPLNYFERAIRTIRAAHPNTVFICVSDNVEDVQDALASENLHFFTGKNVYEDFALMSLCDGGVVSNSTLSWWGGFLSKRKLPIIAPKDWIGFPVGFEYPVGIIGDWMQPIAVEADE